MSPADELRAAAAKLRPSSPAVAAHTVAVRVTPAVADALAELLDTEASVADDMRRQSPEFTEEQIAGLVHGPLAVARAINGGQ